MNGEGIFRKREIAAGISPYHIYLMPYLGTIVNGDWTVGTYTGQRGSINLNLNQVFESDGTLDNDEYKYTIYIGPGTYSIRLWHVMRAFSGICNIMIDNTLVGTKDFYSSTGEVNQLFESAFILDSFGRHDVRIRANGQNISALGFEINFAYIEIERTG